jgi:hypothetical protein
MGFASGRGTPSYIAPEIAWASDWNSASAGSLGSGRRQAFLTARRTALYQMIKTAVLRSVLKDSLQFCVGRLRWPIYRLLKDASLERAEMARLDKACKRALRLLYLIEMIG